MKLRFPRLFAHVLVVGLEAWAGLIRKEVAEESLCLPVGGSVGAENEEGKVEVIRISGRPSLLPFPLFLYFLSWFQSHSKYPLRSIHLLSSHHGTKNYPNPDC